MPNDIKAILSGVVLLVAAAFAYWEHAYGKPQLALFVMGFGIFAIIAMWVFPEAVSKSEVRSKS